MAATAPRETDRKISPQDGWNRNPVVAAGQTLYHGTIAGLDSGGNAKVPGAGVRAFGRWQAANGVSSAAAERGRLEYGCFRWAQTGSTITVAHIGDIVYAADNETVSLDPGAGSEFGVVEDVDAHGVWVYSGLGVGNLYSEET